MSPLRKLELLTMPTPSRVSFNHFPWSTNLLFSFQRRSRPSQTFPRLTTRLGALGRRLGGFTSKSNKCFMDAWRSPKCSRLELKWLTHKSLHPTLESSTKDLDLTKSGWGELKRLLKEYANGQEPVAHEIGVECLLKESRKTNYWSCQSRPVRPVWRRQTGSGHSLKKSLSDGTIGLGPRHV
jgi:hypothetical protein